MSWYSRDTRHGVEKREELADRPGMAGTFRVKLSKFQCFNAQMHAVCYYIVILIILLADWHHLSVGRKELHFRK